MSRRLKPIQPQPQPQSQRQGQRPPSSAQTPASSSSFASFNNSKSITKITKALNLIEPMRSKSAVAADSPAALSNNPTKKHALKLLEREEQNAKKSRLESLLTHQYISKFGTKGPQSAINSFITARIHQFVESFDHLHEAETQIPSLEEEIAQRTSELKQEIRQAKEKSRSAGRVSENNDPALSTGNSFLPTNSTNVGLKTLRELAHSDNPKVNTQWPIINALLKIDEEEKKEKELREKAAKQQKFKQILDEQIHDHELLQRRKEQEKLEQRRLVELEAIAAQREKQLIRQHQEDHFRKERELRLTQIEENKLQREKERQLKILAEKMEMEKSKRLAEEEEERKLKLKEKQKHQQDLLLVENERNREIKHRQLLEKQAYEKKLNEDYERKLDEEERARQNAFKARVQALERFSNGYEAKVASQLQQKAQKENENIHEALQQKERQDMERERAKIENRRLNEMKNLEYNIRVMEEKRKQKEKERLDSIEYRQKIERDLLEAKLAEKADKEKKRIAHIEMKKKLDLQVQMQQQSKLQEKAYYNDSDSLLNPSVLEKLQSDPVLLNKVIDRVNKQNQFLSSRTNAQIF